MMQLKHLLVTKSHTSLYKTHAFRGQCVSCDRTKANTRVLIQISKHASGKECKVPAKQRV